MIFTVQHVHVLAFVDRVLHYIATWRGKLKVETVSMHSYKDLWVCPILPAWSGVFKSVKVFDGWQRLTTRRAHPLG